MALTVKFASGLKESASPVMGSSRAILLRVCPPMFVKRPPTKILPSACTTIAATSLSAFGLKESSQSGGGIEPGDFVARLSADGREIAAR